MKLNKQLILEGFFNHLKRNKGKYSVGAGVGAGLGATYAAGQGHLGNAAQEFAHDNVGKAMDRLNVSSIYDEQLANRNALAHAVLLGGKTQDDYELQQSLQPRSYIADLKRSVSDSGKKFVNLDDENNKAFMDRNPEHVHEMGLKGVSNFIKPWVGM